MGSIPLELTALPALDEFRPGTVAASFEFFPPKSAAAEAQARQVVQRLACLRPAFMSVTYGALGSTRQGTRALVDHIHRETGVQAAAHLTCIGAGRAEIDDLAEEYWQAGIRHIVALRGDFPAGAAPDDLAADRYSYAEQLVARLASLHPFEISVAAYPETHPEAISADADLDALKRKIDAGATRAITQFFFDPDIYARFIERAERAGIAVPIVPGLLPIVDFRRAVGFANSCGASIPDWMHRHFEGLDDDHGTRQLIAMAVALEQCRRLHAYGVRQFHFYTLNRAELVLGICHALGIRPASPSSVAPVLS